MARKALVLLVVVVVDLLAYALRRAEMDSVPAYDALMALRALEEDRPDLALVDVGLGKWDGFELLQELRKRSQIPVIMLTGRAAEDDKVRGLDLGADDYVPKPFSHRAGLDQLEEGTPATGRLGEEPCKGFSSLMARHESESRQG